MTQNISALARYETLFQDQPLQHPFAGITASVALESRRVVLCACAILRGYQVYDR